MSAASDTIWWLPAGRFAASGDSIFDPFLRHDCPTAVEPFSPQQVILALVAEIQRLRGGTE